MPTSVPTGCSSVNIAPLVASGSILAQTSPLSGSTIYTPTAAGLFRVSLFNEGTGGGTMALSVLFTDDTGSHVVSSPGTTLPQTFSAVVRCTAGNDIQVAADIFSGSPTFSLFYAVEQLQ